MKEIPGYEGLYSATEDGQIWSHKLKRFLKPHLLYAKNGSCKKRLTLHKNGKERKQLVHRLVAITFIPNPDKKPQVNHIDGNQLNNHKRNLEWATSAENNQHAYNTGLKIARKGAKNCLAKLTEAEILFIRENYLASDKTFGARALSRRFRVSHSVIVNARGVGKRKTYTDVA